jgi:adenylosuccinate lyase
MEFTPLTAISPVDGRYRNKVDQLAAYFSEFGLIRYRFHVEVEYLIALSDVGLPQLPPLSEAHRAELRRKVNAFSEADALAIKKTEETTNHDVKAVEYFLKSVLEEMKLHSILEFVHFGLTSQDINNTATPLSLKEGFEKVYLPELRALIDELNALADEWKDVAMLARTHGQPASPTRLGKELKVFAVRLETQLAQLQNLPFSAKFGGATGNLNAHVVAYPTIDWHAFASDFVQNTLKLSRSFPTTQIEHYDNLAAFCDGLKRIHTILIDFNRDMWTYISMEYFKQKIKAGEVGSSAMPHKVNPIDFENSEGNLGLANALLEHLAAKLPVSRLQRDLTDSTVLRNLGMPLSYGLIALKASRKGISKLLLNKEAFDADLKANWAVVAEAIQTILRREAYPKPYETLKALTRTNAAIDEASIQTFINGLDVSDNVKAEMRAITPWTFTGA